MSPELQGAQLPAFLWLFAQRKHRRNAEHDGDDGSGEESDRPCHDSEHVVTSDVSSPAFRDRAYGFRGSREKILFECM